jgi:lambda repressor-like predicted transcriptional regulator
MLVTTSLTLRHPDRLRAAMDKAGKSTRGLAREAGLSPARIAQLAAGDYPATQANAAVAIAAALELPVAALFEFPDGEALIRLGLIRP